ncbi:MAG: GIY-YIG nuclease family protein [Alphaproteobacteria bacterium]|nr:GIY-YIG nuclease family protein [Alphaproteobacteria bacterium]
MLTLQQILNTQSPLLENARVKIVRHKDDRIEYREMLKSRDLSLEYQKKQSKHVFKNCDYIISFIGTERGQSILFGVFKVNGYEFKNNHYYYRLDQVNEFNSLIDRLVINWGNSTRSWHQYYHSKPKEVIQILPSGYIGEFPGLLSFVLEFDELKKLVDNPDANYKWRHPLSSVNGIYMILDNRTGNQYIGSANGKNGIWQRWGEYVSNYTGGNKRLTALIKSDPNYYKNFRYSVLQTLPSNITKKEIDSIEKLYKEKLGSKAHGLNAN